MIDHQKLLVRAAECEKLASEANDKSIREKLLELASEFHELAHRAMSLETSRLRKTPF
jgi:hypothetical protein